MDSLILHAFKSTNGAFKVKGPPLKHPHKCTIRSSHVCVLLFKHTETDLWDKNPEFNN